MSLTDTLLVFSFLSMTIFIGLYLFKRSGGDILLFYAVGGAVPSSINSLSLFEGFVFVSSFVVNYLFLKVGSNYHSIANINCSFVHFTQMNKTISLTDVEFIVNGRNNFLKIIKKDK